MEPGAPRHDVEGEHPQTSCYRVSRRPVVGQAGKQGYFIKIQSSRSSVFAASVADSFFLEGALPGQPLQKIGARCHVNTMSRLFAFSASFAERPCCEEFLDIKFRALETFFFGICHRASTAGSSIPAESPLSRCTLLQFLYSQAGSAFL
jgi:hypothetical protein